jgi:hypothetical protein
MAEFEPEKKAAWLLYPTISMLLQSGTVILPPEINCHLGPGKRGGTSKSSEKMVTVLVCLSSGKKDTWSIAHSFGSTPPCWSCLHLTTVSILRASSGRMMVTVLGVLYSIFFINSNLVNFELPSA